MSNQLWRRKHGYNLVIPLVVGFMFMALSGPVDAKKTYNEAQLKMGKGGFKRLTDKEIGHLITNRTTLWRHNKATQVKIWLFYHQNGTYYAKVIGNKKYEGKIFKSTYQIKDDRTYYKSVIDGKPFTDRYYGNKLNEIVWKCGGRSKKCSYYSKILKESWDLDSENLKNQFDGIVSDSGKTQTARKEDNAKASSTGKTQKDSTTIWCRTPTAQKGRLVHEVSESRCKEMGGINSGGMTLAEVKKDARLKQGGSKAIKTSGSEKTKSVKKQDNTAKTSELEGQIANLKKSLGEAKKKLTKAQSNLDQAGQAHKSEIASLQNQVDQLTARLRESESKSAEALQDSNSIQEQLAALRKTYEGLTQEHESQAKQFNDRLQKLEAKHTEAVQENESTQQKLTALRENYDSLNQEHETLKSKYEPFKAELEAKYAAARLKDLLALGGKLVTDVQVFLKQNPTVKELVTLLQLNRELKSTLEAGKLDSLEASYNKLAEKLKDIPGYSAFVEAKEKEKLAELERKQQEELERQRKAEEELIKKGEQLALSMREYIVEHMDADDIEQRLEAMTVLEAAIGARDIEKIRELIEVADQGN